MTVQYEFAKNERGELTHISRASRDQKYVCANEACGSEMIVKQGCVRAYHFAHKNVVITHAGETEIHYNTKHLLCDYIRHHIKTKKPVSLEYISKNTGRWSGSQNIIQDADDVKVEATLATEYHPDVAVFRNGNPILALEVVHTHDLEESAIDYLTQTKLPCIKISITDGIYNKILQEYKNERPLVFWSDCSGYTLFNFDKWVGELERAEVRMILEKDDMEQSEKARNQQKAEETKRQGELNEKLRKVRELKEKHEEEQRLQRSTEEQYETERKALAALLEVARQKTLYDIEHVVIVLTDSGICLCRDDEGLYHEKGKYYETFLPTKSAEWWERSKKYLVECNRLNCFDCVYHKWNHPDSEIVVDARVALNHDNCEFRQSLIHEHPHGEGSHIQVTLAAPLSTKIEIPKTQNKQCHKCGCSLPDANGHTNEFESARGKKSYYCDACFYQGRDYEHLRSAECLNHVPKQEAKP